MIDNDSNPYMLYILKQFQLRSLAKLGKKHEVKLLTESLVREGVDDIITWESILSSYQ